jgi:iron complex transport system substrate-binding protein
MIRPIPARRGRAAGTLAAATALTLALAACGGSSEEDSAAAPSSEATETTVATAFGDVTVPADPERVVTLAESALDVALGVGITPVGTTASRGGDKPPAYLGEDAASIPVVATVREPNLEAILQAEPEVILAAAGLQQAQYDALSAIAPTVVPEAPATGEWEEPLHTYAEALGADDELTELLDAVTARAEKLADDGALSGTAAVVRWMANGPVIMNAANMPGRLLQAAGAEPVQAAVDLADAPHSDPLSLENLGEVDADRLFLAAFGADGASALEAAEKEPAFTRLKAAESGATSSVDGGVWSSSAGPIAADQVMDDIEAAVS